MVTHSKLQIYNTVLQFNILIKIFEKIPQLNSSQANLLVYTDKITDNVSTDKSKWHYCWWQVLPEFMDIYYFTYRWTRKPPIMTINLGFGDGWASKKNRDFNVSFVYSNNSSPLMSFKEHITNMCCSSGWHSMLMAGTAASDWWLRTS